jgi:hypothetical protein
MAKAGFWAIGGYEISFRRDGRWYADDEPIANERIARLFSQHVRPGGDGGWVVDLGIDRQPVTVEDTALVVSALEGDPETGFRVVGNDAIETTLDCDTLRVGPDNALYCDLDRGERGTIRARFLRPAYYTLTSFVEQDRDEAGEAYLLCRGRRYRLRKLES